MTVAQRIPALGPSISWYEDQLAAAQRINDPERTLFVQLEVQEALLLAFGLLWIGRLYGLPASMPLLRKLEELMQAQDFYQPPGAGGLPNE